MSSCGRETGLGRLWIFKIGIDKNLHRIQGYFVCLSCHSSLLVTNYFFYPDEIKFREIVLVYLKLSLSILRHLNHVTFFVLVWKTTTLTTVAHVISCSQIKSPWMRDIHSCLRHRVVVLHGLPAYLAWRAGVTTLCRRQLYPPSQGLWIWLLDRDENRYLP